MNGRFCVLSRTADSKFLVALPEEQDVRSFALRLTVADRFWNTLVVRDVKPLFYQFSR